MPGDDRIEALVVRRVGIHGMERNAVAELAEARDRRVPLARIEVVEHRLRHQEVRRTCAGVVLDLEADTAQVVGLGVLTIRRNGQSSEIATGTTVPIDVLREGPGVATRTTVAVSAASPSADDAPRPAAAASLGADIDRLGGEFDAAMEQRDASAAVAAALALDDAMTAWATDSLQSDEMDRARALLRSMVVRLGEASTRGLADPRELLAPVVQVALAVRTEVRAAKRYDLSDQIRDGLAAAGIEVRDTPAGQEWDLLER